MRSIIRLFNRQGIGTRRLLHIASGAAQFSTNLSPDLVDMTDVPENTLTIEPVGPAVPPSGRRRAKRTMPSDPRRSPETIADPSPDGPPGEAPSRTGHAVSIAGGIAVLRAALRNVP